MGKLSRSFVIAAWALSITVAVIAIAVWGQGVAWQFNRLSTYQIFPIFGLLAFSVMWSHYVVASLRKYFGLDKSRVHLYFEATSWFVLLAICLHPGLLVWQLWRDGLGLPPGSYMHYVRPGLAWVTLLGTTAWLLFIAYEFRRWFKDRSWWKYVQYGSDLAMLLIFYHALRLGRNLQTGWFRYLWFFYGISFVLCLIYLYWPKNIKTAT